jgi:hypothetical protein
MRVDIGYGEKDQDGFRCSFDFCVGGEQFLNFWQMKRSG